MASRPRHAIVSAPSLPPRPLDGVRPSGPIISQVAQGLLRVVYPGSVGNRGTIPVAGYRIYFPRAENQPGDQVRIYPGTTNAPQSLTAPSFILSRGAEQDLIFDKDSVFIMKTTGSVLYDTVLYIATAPGVEFSTGLEDYPRGAPPSGFLVFGQSMTGTGALVACGTAAPTANSGFLVDGVNSIVAAILDNNGVDSGGTVITPWWRLTDPTGAGLGVAGVTNTAGGAVGWLPDDTNAFTSTATSRIAPFQLAVRPGSGSLGGLSYNSPAGAGVGNLFWGSAYVNARVRMYFQVSGVPGGSAPILYVAGETVP